MRLRVLLFLPLTAVAVVAWVGSAGAGSFTDPRARVFTLDPAGSIASVVVLANGDALYAVRGRHDLRGDVPGRLMRLTAAGALREVQADGAALLAAESADTVLRVPEPDFEGPAVHSVERVHVLTGEVSRVADIPGDWSDIAGQSVIDGLTVLADGTALVAGWTGLFAITSDGRVDRVPGWDDVHIGHGGLVALPGGRFAAIEESLGMLVGDLAGARRELAPGPFLGPLAVSGDGGVIAIAGAFADEPDDVERATVVRVGATGDVTPLMHARARRSGDLGNGDDLPLFANELPTAQNASTGSFALGDDGALLFADDETWDRRGTGLRALVAPESARPRIALRQDGFVGFVHGTVGFRAMVAGTVSVSARDLRTQRVLTGQTTAAAGTLTLDSPPRDRYRMRLRVTTNGGGGAETVAYLDIRRVLPVREARAALKATYAFSDGDEGGTVGTELATCRRKAPREVRCLLLGFDVSHPFDGPAVGSWHHGTRPNAWTTATLRNDGVHTKRSVLTGAGGPVRFCLSVRGPRPDTVAVRIHARCATHIRVAAHLRWGKRQNAVLIATRRLRRGQSWSPTFTTPQRAQVALSNGRRVRGEITVRATWTSRYGPAPEEHGFPILVRR